MSAILLGLSGAAAGAGAWLIARSARKPSLADELRIPSASRQVESGAGGWARRWGGAGADTLARLGLPTRRIRRDLALSDTGGGYLAEKATATAAAVIVPLAITVTVVAGDLPVPAATLLVVAAGVAAACWFAPDMAVIDQARQRRAELRAATSMLADVTVIALAGGAGVSSALTQAAEHGQGWAPGRIRLALHTAAMRRQPPWTGLRDLAAHTGVGELEELAASVQLAGTDGARVRASVAAKAASLRTRELAAADAASQAATERMSLPVMVLVFGFLVLIGYPAVVHVVAGF